MQHTISHKKICVKKINFNILKWPLFGWRTLKFSAKKTQNGKTKVQKKKKMGDNTVNEITQFLLYYGLWIMNEHFALVIEIFLSSFVRGRWSKWTTPLEAFEMTCQNTRCLFNLYACGPHEFPRNKVIIRSYVVFDAFFLVNKFN